MGGSRREGQWTEERQGAQEGEGTGQLSSIFTSSFVFITWQYSVYNSGLWFAAFGTSVECCCPLTELNYLLIHYVVFVCSGGK